MQELPLASAPLARVICQVTFPVIASIDSEGFIGPFQERIRTDYPRLHAEQEAGLLLTGGEIRPQVGGHVWRFKDLSGHWQVSLSKNFLALDTTRYTSRAEFLRRLGIVLGAVQDTIRPVTLERIGLRYVDRIEDADPHEVTELVRQELVGISAVAWGTPDVRLKHAVSDAQFSVGINELRARWGLLPPNATLDPFIDPVPSTSWILDLDMFRMGESEFQVESVAIEVENFSRVIYRFFRWVVTDQFLSRYGAEE